MKDELARIYTNKYSYNSCTTYIIWRSCKHRQFGTHGLFTIPEFPELEAERGMWSAALDAILTTLRYLAPATLITIFWGQQSFLFRILKHIDAAFRAIVFSSEEQKQAVLQWLAEAGPVRVEHLDTVWRHGWILCGVLDAALPGACAGHPPTRLSIKHAQAIADHYLGVEPVFSRQELEENDSLSRHQEWKFATYLDRIRQVLSKLTPPVAKPVSHRTSPEATQFILDYVAKGSGLSAVQVNNKAHFKIYPTAQQSLDPGEITILIRGPKDTYGMAVIPPILGKAQLIRQKLLGLHSKQSFTENVLPLTQGATYLRNYGKNDMNKTYYIPKTQYDIQIEIDSRRDHTKISYVVKLEGKYLVSITSRGQSIVGSPFAVTASHNIISIFERDSFHLEDGEEIDIVDVQTDRKVVLRIVDFVTEKMLLKENGTLEKISDDEAKLLMATDKSKEIPEVQSKTCVQQTNNLKIKPVKSKKFYKAAVKILTLCRVSKIFNDLVIEKQQRLRKERLESCIRPRSQQDIPDIVNSTFTETNVNSYVISELREKFIVPESITVSLKAEKSKSFYDETDNKAVNEIENICINIPMESTRLDTPDSLEREDSVVDEHEDHIPFNRPPPANNPFLNEMFEENYVAAKNFGTFVASEYETNNSQNEETRDSSITIIIDPTVTESPAKISPGNNNPFIDTDIRNLERPKTPVYKIIAGEKISRDEPVIINPKSELVPEEVLGNEFINPFFMHQFQTSHFDPAPITDFIIGAPVSLPPILSAASPEPEMKSLILTKKEGAKSYDNANKDQTENENGAISSESVYSTPLHNLKSKKDTTRDDEKTSSTFHSLESNTMDNCNASTTSDSQFEPDNSDSDRNVTPRKDMWDSAYVSIDDNNSSPDSNNNENMLCESVCKQKFSPSDEHTGLKQEQISNMGPAEREIWQTCSELKCDAVKPPEEIRPFKWEIKRPTFTPIIEESDRSISSSTKDVLSRTEICSKRGETDTVSVAFAELNDMYQEYFPQSETSSTTVADEDNKLHSTEVEYITQTKENGVDSASEVSDVKRHKEELEGTISEVQANVTESISVSQPLQNKKDHLECNKSKVETQFGENIYSNIVLEKKKYWDERIREIEAKSQETAIFPKKRRTSAKPLKHDSLSKRKGKQMIKNFLSAGDYSQVKNINQNDEPTFKSNNHESENISMEPLKSDENLVEKWKKYWDEKLEVEFGQVDADTHGTKSPRKALSPSPQPAKVEIKIKTSQDLNEDKDVTADEHPPVKQELPEEVFKAFETSPKRFFGTSRKHILNKIDTFLGKPDIVTSTSDVTSTCHESGLVSSRISLFHNMSNVEELPWAKHKSQSLHNISQRRESQRSITSGEDSLCNEQTKTKSQTPDELVCTVKTNNVNFAEATNVNISKAANLKAKRSRMTQNAYNTTFDETVYEKPAPENNIPTHNEYVKKTVPDVNNRSRLSQPKVEALRKKSFSKSEMDIFNKVPIDTTNDLDKYKSCEELPKINVKSFISLYESVSKTAEKPSPPKCVYRTSSVDSQKLQSNSITSDAVPKRKITDKQRTLSNSESKYTMPGVTPTNLWTSKTSEAVSNLSLDTKTSDSYDVEGTNDNKETMYLSLSDIELEIIECSPDKSSESSPERYIEPAHIQYKNRFKLAKQYFQSLEELREVKKPRKLNECEMLLRKESMESLEEEQTNERPQKRVKKNIKSHSLPSSEIAKAWNQLQENQERCANDENSNTRLVKISEKFHVEDLFTDVTEGKLSRQGSLRGIPHKKAVLEAFRSMENVADTTKSSYEIAESQLTDFAKEHRIQNAQTYLSEYPYLPTTDPSKYHSRLDVKASGLISLKELKERKPRRNSVPDLRLNPNFTVDV